jgi:hypothetical protein
MEALLYDVHGNLPALDAVLHDAQDAAPSLFILGGDYALFGGWPLETVERLQHLPNAIWIRGNGERWLVQRDKAPDNEVVQGAITATREALGDKLADDLAALPISATRHGTMMCHGSPVSDVRSSPLMTSRSCSPA